MLGLTGGALAGLLLTGCGPDDGTTGTGGSTAGTAGEAGSGGTRGIVFNTASRDVTLFDPGENRVTGSRPTSAVVRWLSNEQHYFDGERIWTYDFPDGEVEAIALHPETFEVTARIPVGGEGPGHSLVLSPDNSRAFVNSAGSDFLAVVDPAAGEVLERVETGPYP
ncbi:MAG: hypothetical protein H0V53_10515 [Rubrobacter sp.]|nr:hypothetical protein [Rubrobacter sp.]